MLHPGVGGYPFSELCGAAVAAKLILAILAESLLGRVLALSPSQ